VSETDDLRTGRHPGRDAPSEGRLLGGGSAAGSDLV